MNPTKLEEILTRLLLADSETSNEINVIETLHEAMIVHPSSEDKGLILYMADNKHIRIRIDQIW